VKAYDDTSFPVQRDHVTGLWPYTNYTFVVRAGNTVVDDVIAWGDWSDAASVVTGIARKTMTSADFYVCLNNAGLALSSGYNCDATAIRL